MPDMGPPFLANIMAPMMMKRMAMGMHTASVIMRPVDIQEEDPFTQVEYV